MALSQTTIRQTGQIDDYGEDRDDGANSIGEICCGFVVQQAVQQIHNKSTTIGMLYNKSTTNWMLYNKSTTSWHVKIVVDLLYNISTPALEKAGLKKLDIRF